MIVKAIKTRKMIPPKDNLWEVLSESIKSLEENSVVAVTSKVLAIGEGRSISISAIEKDELIKREADKYLPRKFVPEELVMFTLKNNMLVASAGIDESNGAGFYILWPKDPQRSAKGIWKFLREKFQVNNLGVIITDSRLMPLRRGVVGICIGYFGFKPLRDYRGKEDLFGREFKMETSNLPDSLATAAVLEMGEGTEQTPIAVITDIPYLQFTSTFFDFAISPEEDMFYPLFSSIKWQKGGGGKTR